MPENSGHEPWMTINALVREGRRRELGDYLDSLSPADVARAVSRLDEEEQAGLLTLLGPEDAADLIEVLSDTQGADLIEELPAAEAAAIVEELDSDHRADLLAGVDTGEAEAILRAMDPREAKDTRQLLGYDPETAGGIMVTEYVVYDQDKLVSEVIADLRANAEKYSDIDVQYAYVQSRERVLVGVLRIRDLILSPGDRKIRDLMIKDPISVTVDTPLEVLEQLFDRHLFLGIPVVDRQGRMTGVVQRADVEEAVGERSEKTFMRYSGIIGGEELRSMPLATRVNNRLRWLTINLILSGVAAHVIIVFQGTIERVIALAALIPIVANVSGCSGNQAVAVSIRELALGILRPKDFFHVVRKEILVGLVNGPVLGLLLGLFVYFWKHDVKLAVVVGFSFALNINISVLWGSAIPLLLRKLRIDPASAAAPMLTTVMDMCGFFIILSLATALLL